MFAWILDKGGSWRCLSSVHIMTQLRQHSFCKTHILLNKSGLRPKSVCICAKSSCVMLTLKSQWYLVLFPAALPKHLKWRLPMAIVLVSPHILHTLQSVHTNSHCHTLYDQVQNLYKISRWASVFCGTDDDDGDDCIYILLCNCGFDVIHFFWTMTLFPPFTKCWYKKKFAITTV